MQTLASKDIDLRLGSDDEGTSGRREPKDADLREKTSKCGWSSAGLIRWREQNEDIVAAIRQASRQAPTILRLSRQCPAVDRACDHNFLIRERSDPLGRPPIFIE